MRSPPRRWLRQHAPYPLLAGSHTRIQNLKTRTQTIHDSSQFDVYGANRHEAETTATASGGKLRALSDNFLVVEQAIVTSKGAAKKIAELNRFVEDVRANGFVQQALDRTRILGLAVATGTNR